jgi:antitoxin YefM
MVSESEWASIEETLYLLQSPANAKRLLNSVAELDAN